jgi:FAD dependent oxidoreductase
MSSSWSNWAATIGTYQVPGFPLYLIGAFDTGVTVMSQQVRAMNLVWALVESGAVRCDSAEAGSKRTSIAIVGGGFAGLSAAAALLKKGANAEITIFEQRDTLLPLQQGSDSRWLHPRIYDWPQEGSDASVAMLPVLNWTAARASDVVVQILSEWKTLVASAIIPPRLFCNARHLQVHENGNGTSTLGLEWVGELRNADSAQGAVTSAIGGSSTFDVVILAMGFGLERDGALSYWRNETISQPNLSAARQTFLVSGQGDGAMIDLLRLRIAQFRQDRILDELFGGKAVLLDAIIELQRQYRNDRKQGMFDALEELTSSNELGSEVSEVTHALSKRLRRDTEVILHLRVRKFAELFDPASTRISFQNRLLVYFLYKCGGFFPSTADESDLQRQHAIPEERVIRRHGTLRDEQIEGTISRKLWEAIERRRGNATPDPLSQTDDVLWPGGYFGFAGSTSDAARISDAVRQRWRKEYLPGPTVLIATAFCAALSGFIQAAHREVGRLRVTLHRAITFGNEELLQQACDYVGSEDAGGAISTAGRTFPVEGATIGMAYRCRRIVRSSPTVSSSRLRQAMESLDLSTASRSMSHAVRFVLAIPILEPARVGEFTGSEPVVGVLYVDSTASEFYINNAQLRTMATMAQSYIIGLERVSPAECGRTRNVPTTRVTDVIKPAGTLPISIQDALELVEEIDPPVTANAFQLNFDHSDFIPVEAREIR